MDNPFGGSDNDYSSADESNIFDTSNNTESIFDFDKWITDNKLSDLKDCFSDHNMTTLDTLNLHNPNFSKLTADTRVLMKAHLIQNIVSGIQALETLRKSIKEKESKNNDDEKEGAAPETTKPALVFMSTAETKVFETMQRYIKELTDLRNELSVVTKQDFELRKEQNRERIEKYEMIHCNKLDGINTKMHLKFQSLHKKLNEISAEMDTKLDGHKQEILGIQSSHKQLLSVINGKYQHCLSMIDTDTQTFKGSIEKSKKIIKKYDDATEEKDDISNENFKFETVNVKRENEICAIGDAMVTHYNQNQILLSTDNVQIQKYVSKDLNLTKSEVYAMDINQNIYTQIVSDITALIHIKSTEHKSEQKAEPNMSDSINDLIKDINEIELELNMSDEEDVAFDELYTATFKAKPFGLTFGTNEKEKNLFVTSIGERSLAAQLGVIVGSKVITIQDEIVRDLGSSDIYRVFNNKFGKVLPLKITFERPKVISENSNVRFDSLGGINTEVWELTNEKRTIQNKASNYEPFTSYSVYLCGKDSQGKGFSKGVHSVSVKCVKLNEEQSNGTKCCIGVTSERRNEWVIKGINQSWPKIGVFSFFDGWAEEPYWYGDETIVCTLDIPNLSVSYFTINEQNKKKTLIKTQKIAQAKSYYFMMCAVTDPTVQYTIK